MKTSFVYLCLCIFAITSVAAAQTIAAIEGVVELRESDTAPWLPAFMGDSFASGSSLRSLQGELVLDNNLTLNDCVRAYFYCFMNLCLGINHGSLMNSHIFSCYLNKLYLYIFSINFSITQTLP